MFLPNGAPVQRVTRFTVTTEDGMRTDFYFTDSNGRIDLPRMNSRFILTVETDKETYDTTTVTFDPAFAGRYLNVNLKPLKSKASNPAGVVSAGENVSPKAKQAYEAASKLLQAGQYDKAIEPLKRAIAIQADYFQAYSDLGAAYMKLNQLDQAEDALRHAVKLNDKDFLPQLNLGIVLNRQGKYKEAAELLARLERSQSGLAAVHPALIEALMGAQLWPQAEEELQKALAVKGADVVDLKIKMGTVLIRQGKFEAAVSHLREATKAEPDSALAQLNLGAALMQMGSLDEAVAALRRAYELKGTSMAGAQLLLGQIYFKKNEYSKSIEAFETYLRDMPDAPNAADVKNAIQRLRQAINK